MYISKRQILIFSCIFSCMFSFLSASHNASRYFPFIEKPEEHFIYKKSYFYPGFFFTVASTAFGREGGNAGIPELWGKYNLKSVIAGLAQYKAALGESGYNPFAQEVGYGDWSSKDLLFYVDGKIKSRGVVLQWDQYLYAGFSLGAFVPLMHANTSIQFSFNSAQSHADARDVTKQEEEMLDRVRRRVHTDLCLQGGDWSHSGFGDVDVYARWNHEFDHPWKFRTINVMTKTGLVIPTGVKAKHDYPSSVPFMGNGHWCPYLDLGVELELKQNWRLGCILGVMDQLKDTSVRRLAYHNEPVLFGPLVGDVSVDPGLTYKICSYFTLENVMDGLHFQCKHTYLRHNADTWKDLRCTKPLQSYLACSRERCKKERLSSWRSHYVTLQLAYDSVDAMKNWFWKPKIYTLLDYAFTGRGSCKTHQFTLGVELHPW